MNGARGQRPVVIWRKWFSPMAAEAWIGSQGARHGRRLIVTEEVHRRKIRVDVYPANVSGAVNLKSRYGGRVVRLRPEAWLRPQRPRRTAICAGRLIVTAGKSQALERERRDPGLAVIWIPAGPAFGTGQHATTRMCLRALSEAWPFESLLDAGCGTGILAIAGAKLGARRVRAFDNDPAAVRETRKNAGLNHVHLNVRRADLASLRGARFDVVIANILSGPLVANARRLSGATKPGGLLVLSGIRPNQANEVIDAFAACHLVRRRGSDGWMCLLMRKNGPAADPRL